ncbi:MAG TPA: response regulator [Draconibacterium sp.]|nr:response regulator [Draconibacterium sp.]
MGKTKILIVDDLMENLISLEMLLSEFCVVIDKATSGEEALRKTMTEDYAMAILDVQMPGMDGYETLSLMRKRIRTKYLPVIFVSAIHQSDLHIIKGIEAGAVDFIPKPIIPEILTGKVKIFLDLHFQKKKLNGLLQDLEETNRELEILKAKAEEATKAKAIFLANMSHEIRTPLNGVIGFSKVLEETELNEEQKELTEIIVSSGENLLNIINDILDFSKIESGQFKLETIEFSLFKTVHTIIKLHSFFAEKKGIDLQIEIDAKLPDKLFGDPLRLNQVITNLVSNALKFTDKGSVKLSVGSIKKDAKKITLLFKVIDTGIGITDEGKEKLFKEFSQTDSYTTRKYGGTGLGLTISRNLVSLMGGEIGVKSVIGKGSEFWFSVPYLYSDKIIKTEKQKNEPEEFELPPNIKILYAEDNLLNQRVTTMLLQKLGITCDIAQDGLQAFEMYKKNEYDLILMDMQMPVLDGIESTKEIRKYENLKNIENPIFIVAITANSDLRDKQICIDAGMNDFISKPFKESDIKEKIRNALRNDKYKIYVHLQPGKY